MDGLVQAWTIKNQSVDSAFHIRPSTDRCPVISLLQVSVETTRWEVATDVGAPAASCEVHNYRCHKQMQVSGKLNDRYARGVNYDSRRLGTEAMAVWLETILVGLVLKCPELERRLVHHCY